MSNNTQKKREIFADRLQKAMDYRNISVKELAEQSGRSEVAVRSWLYARRSISLGALFDIVNVLDVFPGYLLGDNPIMEEQTMDVADKIVHKINTDENWTEDVDSLIKMADELNPEQRRQIGELLEQLIEKAGVLSEKK